MLVGRGFINPENGGEARDEFIEGAFASMASNLQSIQACGCIPAILGDLNAHLDKRTEHVY